MVSLSRGRDWALLIGGIALLVRLAYQLEVRGLPEYTVLVLDPHIHDAVGRAIAGGNVIGAEPFFRAPLYLYLLGFLYSVFGPSPWSARLLQAVLGSATAVLAYRLGRRCFSEWIGRIAGLATALTWTLVYFDGEILITSLATFLDLLLVERLLAAADRPSGRRWFLGGIVLGLAAIARPTVLVFGWLAVLWIWWALGKGETASRRLRAAALYVLGSLVVIAPVTVRNAAVGRDFVLIASQGGVNFYLGNNPVASGWSATSPEIGKDWWGGFDDAVWIAEEEAGRRLRPSEVSRYWIRRGLEFWVREPAAALALDVRKLFFFWGGMELGNNRDIEFFRQRSWVLRVLPFSFGWFAPLAILGMAVGGRRRDRMLLVLFVLLYTVAVVLFFVCARFRMPVAPVLAVFAAAGGGWLVAEFRARTVRRALPVALGLGLLASLLWTDLYGVRDARHTQSFFNLGLVYSRLGDEAGAERAYLEALDRDPGYVDALNNLGGLYARQRRWVEAGTMFQRVLLNDPANAKAIYNLGAVNENVGNPKVAELRYREALDVDPHFLPASVGLGRMLEARGDVASARAAYESAYRAYRSQTGLGPGDIRVHFEEEAQTSLIDIAIALGRVAEKQDMWGAALEYYEEALDLARAVDPEAEQSHYRVGYVLMKMEHYEEARVEMEAELERFPENLAARYALALCYASTGSVLPAIRELKNVVSQDPRHDRAWDNLGVLYAKSDSYDEAIAAFERALEANPGNLDARRHLEMARKYGFQQ